MSALHPREQVRQTAPVVTVSGIDLAQNSYGWLHRAFAGAEGVRVDTSYDAGATWEEATAAPGGAGLPTLVLDTRNWLCVWYHAGSTSYARASFDLGATWEDWAEHAGITHPRAVWWQGLLHLAACADGEIALYESTDWGRTLTPRSTIATADAQLPALRMDTRGWLHVLYESGGEILHTASQDGETWRAPNTLAAGRYPTLSIGLLGGLLGYWGDDGLQTARLTGSLGAAVDTAAGPAEYRRGYCGALVNAREQPYLAGFDAGLPATRWAQDLTDWAEPA